MAKRTLEVLLALGFILLAVAALCAWASPTTGYESSIYASTPIAVWICFFLAITCSIISTIGSLYFTREHNRLWIHGLVLLTLSYVFIFSLFIIRGYTMLGANGDAGTHLGFIKDIMSEHHFRFHILSYPITHIFLAQLSLVANISPIVLINLATPFAVLLYTAFIYLLARSIFHGTRVTVLITLAASCTFFGYTLLFPNNLADLMLPMALFVLFKSFGERAWGWRILLLATLLFFPMFHQVTAIALATVLIAALVVFFFISRHKRSARRILWSNILVLAALAIWVIVWQSTKIHYTYFPSLFPIDQANITISPSGIPTSTSHLNKLIALIHYVDSYGYSAVEQFFKQYGITLVYLVLTLVALPSLLKAKTRNWKAASLYGALIAIGLIMVILSFTAIKGGTLRYTMYLLTLGSLFAGFTLYTLIRWAKNKHKLAYVLALSMIILLLLGIATNSTLLKYSSPYTLSINEQNTKAEIEGTGWFISNKNLAIETSGWNFPLERYINYHLGFMAGYESANVYKLPRHLGYDVYDSIGQNFKNDTYFVLTELNRRYYVDVLPNMAGDFLLSSDIARVDNDSSANHIYANGELDIWYIYSGKGANNGI